MGGRENRLQKSKIKLKKIRWIVRLLIVQFSIQITSNGLFKNITMENLAIFGQSVRSNMQSRVKEVTEFLWIFILDTCQIGSVSHFFSVDTHNTSHSFVWFGNFLFMVRKKWFLIIYFRLLITKPKFNLALNL